jgi:hypothetical protein
VRWLLGIVAFEGSGRGGKKSPKVDKRGPKVAERGPKVAESLGFGTKSRQKSAESRSRLAGRAGRNAKTRYEIDKERGWAGRGERGSGGRPLRRGAHLRFCAHRAEWKAARSEGGTRSYSGRTARVGVPEKGGTVRAVRDMGWGAGRHRAPSGWKGGDELPGNMSKPLVKWVKARV